MRAQSLLSKHAPQAKALADIEAMATQVRSGGAFDTRVALTANG
jgi:hypothetical protein